MKLYIIISRDAQNKWRSDLVEEEFHYAQMHADLNNHRFSTIKHYVVEVDAPVESEQKKSEP